MTFSRSEKLLCAILLSLLFPALAGAQEPRAGGVSVWGSGGFVAPSEGVFHTTFGLSGGIDYFLTRALSVGVTAGGWRTNTDLGSHANQLYFDALGTYNWERGKLHPFVQGGLGIYKEDFPARSSSTKFGGFAGAGLDVFVTGTWALEGVVRYHLTESDQGLGGSFLEALAGAKFYF